MQKSGHAAVRPVVIVRLRGRVDLGTTFIEVLARYAGQLDAVGSRLMVVSVDDRVRNQLAAGGVLDLIGPDGVYGGDERVGAALDRASADAHRWVEG